MLNQIFLYVCYGLGALFLIGGIILMIGILKPSNEKAAAAKEAKAAAAAAKAVSKADAKRPASFGKKTKNKEFFTTNDIGEGGNGFQLDTSETVSPLSAPAFEVPKNSKPPKNSFQAAAFAAKKGEQPVVETVIEEPTVETPTFEANTAPEPQLPASTNKSVFGGGGFKLAEGSDSDKDEKPSTNRFGLPF